MPTPSRMERLRRQVARACGKLPGTSGLIGFVVCCALPCKICRGLFGFGRCKSDAETELPNLGSWRVLLLGLDGSGKSSFLWMCENPHAPHVPSPTRRGKDSGTSTAAPPGPTTGVLRLMRKGIRPEGGERCTVDLDLSEVGGGESFRRFWGHYITPDVATIVFFADAAAPPDRMAATAAQLEGLCEELRRKRSWPKLVLVASRAADATAADQTHAALKATTKGLRCRFVRIDDLYNGGARTSADHLLEIIASVTAGLG